MSKESLAMREAAFDMIEAGIRLHYAALIQRANLRFHGEWHIDYDRDLGAELQELDGRRKRAREESAK